MRIAGAVVVVAAVLASLPTAAGAAQQCRAVGVPVALDSGAARLSGDICSPMRAVPALRRTVQVLVSGTAYDKSYWDFPYQPATYSYVRAARAAGFATFNVDRLGMGASSHPAATQVTIPSNASTIHQAITRLRAGAVDGVHYDRVVLVGHSLGSLIAWYEAAQYRDVDAVISSGILHTFDGPGVARFGAALYPAAFDPAFAGRISDPGYLTTMPGTRATTFYYLPTADRQVIDTDERLKSTATMFEARDVFEQEAPGTLGGVRDALCPLASCESAAEFWYGVTTRITVPVLTVIGQYDGLLCGAGKPNRCNDFDRIRADERRYFRGVAQRCLTVTRMPDTGHDLNLHRSAPSWFALANSWSAAALRPSACPVASSSSARSVSSR